MSTDLSRLVTNNKAMERAPNKRIINHLLNQILVNPMIIKHGWLFSQTPLFLSLHLLNFPTLHSQTWTRKRGLCHGFYWFCQVGIEDFVCWVQKCVELWFKIGFWWGFGGDSRKGEKGLRGKSEGVSGTRGISSTHEFAFGVFCACFDPNWFWAYIYFDWLWGCWDVCVPIETLGMFF